MRRTRPDPDAGQTRDRVLDAAESLIFNRGIAAFTLDAVAQAAGISKGGLLYHFSSKDVLVSALQHRMAMRLEEKVREAEARSESALQAVICQLRRDFENGGHRFAPLLLAREQPVASHELQSVVSSLMRRSGLSGNTRGTLLVLAALGLILSCLAGLPCPEPERAASLFAEMEAMAAQLSERA